MRRLTFGQVFVLFDSLAQYVKLTSPWGGDSESSGSGGSKGSPELPGAIPLLGPSAGDALNITTKEQLPDDIRDLLK